MKKIITAFVFCFLCGECFSQAGEWVWIKGDSVPNQAGNFGVQGVPSPTNNPPSLYEPCEWTDLNGNFWLFGGLNSNVYGDLWKYDLITNEWTWMKGSGNAGNLGHYGTLGISAPNNNPPARAYGMASWMDAIGNLWMFGGVRNGGGLLSDLWKYNIATNEWTWMKGPNTPNQAAVYGIQGVPDPANNPAAHEEASAAWVDNAGDFWLYAGNTYDNLWRYNISANQWTWMKGSQVISQTPIYGIKGVENNFNTPGSRWTYSHWKDNTDKFWLFSGVGVPNDLWRYNPVTNNWGWISGDTVSGASGNYGINCIAGNMPGARWENRLSYTDQNNNFWMFGGWFNAGFSNDLWKYCVAANKWVWVSGDSTLDPQSNYGMLNVSSPSNKPNGRAGAVGWTDHNEHLYFFGGYSTGVLPHNDLWKYTIDTTCGVCPAPNSIQENNPPKVDELLVFPNPTNSSLTISFSSAEKQIVELRIYNTLGELNLFQSFKTLEKVRGGKFEKEINVEKLSDGIYFLQLKTKEGLVSKKVVVEK